MSAKGDSDQSRERLKEKIKKMNKNELSELFSDTDEDDKPLSLVGKSTSSPRTDPKIAQPRKKLFSFYGEQKDDKENLEDSILNQYKLPNAKPEFITKENQENNEEKKYDVLPSPISSSSAKKRTLFSPKESPTTGKSSPFSPSIGQSKRLKVISNSPAKPQHVTEVRISEEVMEVCWTHALSTEKLEVAGMLIGSTQDKVVNIHTLKVGKRSTKESARVEIDDNELIEAAECASSLDKDGSPLRVIGWYHSHPHITVLPSDVDLRTQAGYQLMDNQFVGLIFSVFSEDKNVKEERRQVIAFQSADRKDDGSYSTIELPLVVQSHLSRINKKVFVSVYSALTDTFMKLVTEEMDDYKKHVKPEIKDRVAELHNAAQLTARLANIHKIILEPVHKSLDLRLKIAGLANVNKCLDESTSGPSVKKEMNTSGLANVNKCLDESTSGSSVKKEMNTSGLANVNKCLDESTSGSSVKKEMNVSTSKLRSTTEREQEDDCSVGKGTPQSKSLVNVHVDSESQEF